MSSANTPRPDSKLFRAGAVTGSMTLLSRISGLIRDNVIGQAFGAGAAADAFFVAFKIPNFLRRMFGEGAFAQAFVPVFSEYRETQDEQTLRDLVGHVAGVLGGVLLLITTLGAALAPWLIVVFAPGFMDDPYRLGLAGEMLRITFPYLFCVSLVAAAGGVFNAHGRFALAAFTPVLLNLCMIAAALWLTPLFDEPIVALAWGVFFAGIVQLLFQLPLLARLGLLTMPRWNWDHPGVERIRTNMLPILFGSSVAQINLLLDTIIASFLVAGSVSWLYFSDRMVEFPLGVFGIALATVVLPHLSTRHASRQHREFEAALDWALRLTILIAVPAALGLIALAAPIIATVFEYGKFDQHDTHMSAFSLMAYATGLPGFIAVKLLAASFFARQDTRTPVRCAVIALIANTLMNIVFVLLALWSKLVPAHTGLALATAIAAWLQAGLLLHALRRQNIYRATHAWLQGGARVLIACALMVGVTAWLSPAAEDWSNWGVFARAGTLTGLIAAAIAVYFASLAVLRLPWNLYRGPTH